RPRACASASVPSRPAQTLRDHGPAGRGGSRADSPAAAGRPSRPPRGTSGRRSRSWRARAEGREFGSGARIHPYVRAFGRSNDQLPGRWRLVLVVEVGVGGDVVVVAGPGAEGGRARGSAAPALAGELGARAVALTGASAFTSGAL